MTRTIQQSQVDFSVNYKVQTTWGLQEAITFVLEGLGASLFFLALLGDQLAAMVAGILILMASGILLILHLGNPKNMIYVLANIRHSWMSRGAALIPLFIVAGALFIAAELIYGLKPAGPALITLFLLLSVFVALKSGLVMTTFPAIAFWNGGLLPVLFALSGLASGATLYAVFDGEAQAAFYWLLPALFAALLIATLIYLVTIKDAGRSAKVSVDLIGERYPGSFYGAAMLLGMVLPLVIGIYLAFVPSAASVVLFVIMAAARLAGDIVLRHVFLKVGVFDKVR